MQTEEARAVETDDTPLYRRDLPGGGFVAIHVHRERGSGSDREISWTRVYVERRGTADRRSGHEPPVILQVRGDASAPEIGELYHVASDNVALARAILRWQSGRAARSG